MLRDEDVTSKAMRRKLARAAGGAAAGALTVPPDAPEPAQPPAALPGQQQQQQQSGAGGGGFFSYMLSNVMMGMGMTLGFIAVAAVFRSLTGTGAQQRAPQQQSLERPLATSEAREDPYDTSSRRPGSETRI